MTAPPRVLRPRACTVRAAAAIISALAWLLGVARAPQAADPPGTPASRDALALCHRAQDAGPGERDALLAQALERAEEATEADDADALAHFARFCALGEQARRSGSNPMNLFRLRPIRREIDRTLELAPDFPDALVGKGAFLMSVPGFLGGDDEAGERLLRRALDIDPQYVGARLRLAENLAKHGRRDEARHEAELALAAAEAKGETADAEKARHLLADADR
ncbi:MAG TPA: hypothetical protein VFD92_22460 [Candidatus Binatia bacterium]|nr:hypothetical protein [Candidatus Binatia bacterium]